MALTPHMAEIEDCSSEPEVGSINECKKITSTKNRSASLDSSETTSSKSSSHKVKCKGKGVACKRHNPRVVVRRTRANNVATIGFPLGMSFAAVMAQMLYRRDVAAESMSPSHLSSMCTSAIKESLATVFGDKLDDLTRNFEQSFDSTLSTLRLIYESSTSNEGNKFNNMKMKIPSSKLTLDKGDYSSVTEIADGQSMPNSSVEIQDQSISHEEVKDGFHMDSVSHGFTLLRQPNQMVCFSPTSGSVINHPTTSTFEKSIVEQCRSNDLKTLELGLKMRKLKLKETELSLSFDSNNIERSKLAMGVSKQSFKAEKFKSQKEDKGYGELHKKCIDCLIAGLFVMACSLLYAAYCFSSDRIAEATESCTLLIQETSSWWTPKYVASLNSGLQVLWCKVQVVSRQLFGFLMIFAVGYLIFQRSTTSSQAMPVTFILLMLGIGCGYCGKLCVDTMGGSGYVWLLYWEILCFLHFLSIGFTSALYPILHGPITISQTPRENTIFQYWVRRFLFYATLVVFLPLFCGLMPFASLRQWKDHFMLKVLDFNESEM